MKSELREVLAAWRYLTPEAEISVGHCIALRIIGLSFSNNVSHINTTKAATMVLAVCLSPCYSVQAPMATYQSRKLTSPQAVGQICSTASMTHNLAQCRAVIQKAVTGGAKVSRLRPGHARRRAQRD